MYKERGDSYKIISNIKISRFIGDVICRIENNYAVFGNLDEKNQNQTEWDVKTIHT